MIRPDAKVDFSNAPKFLQQIRRAGAQFAKGLAEEHIERAKALVPVRTGALKNSLHVEAGKHEGEYLAIAGDEKVNYAAVVEFGGRGGTQAAQPYHTPAREATFKNIGKHAKRVNPFR